MGPRRQKSVSLYFKNLPLIYAILHEFFFLFIIRLYTYKKKIKRIYIKHPNLYNKKMGVLLKNIKHKNKFLHITFAILLALQSADILHDHHDHDHEETGHYCVACNLSNLDVHLDEEIQYLIYNLELVSRLSHLVSPVIKDKILSYNHPRSPPFSYS